MTSLREWMEEMSRGGEGIPVSKANVRTMINDMDGWLDANAAAAKETPRFRGPTRNAISQSGKGRAMTLIIAKRWIRGS